MSFFSDFTEKAIQWAEVFLPAIFASGAATSISAAMSIYDGKPLVKTITGALSCGVLTLTIAGSLELFGLPGNSVTFAGAVIGFVGAEKIRDKLLGWFEKRVGGKNENE